jgi:hypothetical protein
LISDIARRREVLREERPAINLRDDYLDVEEYW